MRWQRELDEKVKREEESKTITLASVRNAERKRGTETDENATRMG